MKTGKLFNSKSLLAAALSASMLATLFPADVYAMVEKDGKDAKETEVSAEDETTDTAEDETADASDETVKDEKDVEDKEQSDDAEKEAKWGIYIYMCGSNLESVWGCGTQNLEGLMEAPANEDVNYIVQTGGSNEWQNDFTDAEHIQRFKLEGDEADCVYEGEIEDMADPVTLTEFVTWCNDNYPAEKTMLLIWDHGGAIRGAASDEIYEDDLMSIPDYVSAFEKSDAHFDIIDFDCCLMADFDVCLNLAPFTDYIVASEETIAGSGQDYEGMAQKLYDNPACSAKSFGRSLCDNFVDNLTDLGEEENATLALIETDKLANLKESVSGMVDAMIDQMGDTEVFGEILNNAYCSKHYYYTFEKDLVSLARDLKGYVDEDACNRVIDSVRDAVIYKVQANESKYNNGISFYWQPNDEYGFESTYADMAVLDNYLAFIDAIDFSWNAPNSLYERTERLPQISYHDYTVEAELSKNKKDFDTLKITNGIDAVSSVEYSILGTYQDEQVELSKLGNLDILKGGKSFSPRFTGRVASIDGNNVVLNVFAEAEDYVLYDIPVVIPDLYGDSAVNLRVAFYPDESIDDPDGDFVGSYMDGDNGSFSIVGVESSTTAASTNVLRGCAKLPYGTDFYPVYQVTDGSGRSLRGEKITYTRDTAVEMMDLPDGQYGLCYDILSSLGQTIETDSCDFYIVNSEITFEAPEGEAGETEEAEEDWAGNAVTVPLNMLEDTEAGSYHMDCCTYEEYYGEKSDDEEKENARITLMIYMVGQSTEADFGYDTKYLEAFSKGKDSENVNVIVEVGGTTGWKNDFVDEDSIQRFEIHNGQFVEVEKKPLGTVSSENELEDFIRFGKENYPADHYIIQFFDHGSAWLGYGHDDIYDVRLSVDDIATAIKKNDINFDLLYFNCCIMGSFEVASALSSNVHYMVASAGPTIQMYCAEDEWVDYLSDHAENFDAEKAGKFVCDRYMDDLENANISAGMYSQELGVLDLTKADALVDAVDKLGSEMCDLTKDPEKLTELIKGLDSAKHYADISLKDLADLAGHATGVSKETIAKVTDAIDDVVVYKACNTTRRESCGINIFFNVNETKGRYLNKYSKICPSKEYLAFLDSVIIRWHPGTAVLDSSERIESVNPYDYKVEDTAAVSDDEKSGYIEIDSDPLTINDIKYVISEYDEDQDRFDLVYQGTGVTVDGNKVANDFDGRYTCIGGYNCYMSYDYTNKGCSYFRIPVLYAGDRLSLMVRFAPDEDADADSEVTDYDNGSFEILGLAYDSAYDTKGMSYDPLDNGDELTLLIPEMTSDGSITGYLQGDTITYDASMTIGLRSMEDGEYVMHYVIVNGLMKETLSDPFIVTIKNGRVQKVELIEDDEEEE